MSKKLIKIEEPKKIEPITVPTVKPSIFINTLNLVASPAKKRYQKHYQPQKNKFWYLHLSVDLILLLITLILIGFNAYFLTHPAIVEWRQNEKQGQSANNQPAVTCQTSPRQKNVSIGQTLDYDISCVNSGSADAYDAIVNLYLESEIFDGRKNIILTADKYPSLSLIKAQEKINLNSGFVLNPTTNNPQNPNQIITAWTEVSYHQDKNNEQSFTASESNSKKIQKIIAELKVDAIVRYKTEEGDQVGFGPLPPKVGQPTKYWIFFSAKTNYGTIKNFQLTAKLPNNVRATGKISGLSPEPITIKNQTVSWKISELSPLLEENPIIGSALEVEIIPQTEQIGLTGNLLEEIEVSAIDNFNNYLINRKISDLTTKITENSGIIKK